ncbi:MAG: trypsin-like peptidase domain-containing protein [Actinomycetota bacterium]|nr:trypsin-like peptidase domain-containing protein [Actinomycetota bacterium]
MTIEAAVTIEAADQELPLPAPARRLRPGFRWALVVAAVAWFAGLFGAFVGTRLAEDERGPARTASTLGLVRAEPRTDPLPEMDVYAAAATVAPSVVSIHAVSETGELVGRSSGTGVVLTPDGEILTNAHVVNGAAAVNVRVAGETEPRAATVVALDESRDLALLRIDADRLQAATFADPADIRVGDEVVAVGYALDLDGDPTVTAGIVSALGRTSADDTMALKGLIQTDAPISSGNSGGPLVNSLGEVVGIVTFVALADIGTTANSLGFAISNAELLPTVEMLRASVGSGPPAAGYLGVGLRERTDGGSGALVSEVQPDSPAEAAGLEVGDAIVAFGGEAVSGAAGLKAVIRDHEPGDEVVIDVRRDGQALTVTATLVTRPAD